MLWCSEWVLEVLRPDGVRKAKAAHRNYSVVACAQFHDLLLNNFFGPSKYFSPLCFSFCFIFLFIWLVFCLFVFNICLFPENSKATPAKCPYISQKSLWKSKSSVKAKVPTWVTKSRGKVLSWIRDFLFSSSVLK